jgi:seryl-tRNA synthetase
MTLTTDQMCEVIDRAMDDIRELRRENAALLNALEEARDERDEARRQRDDVLDELEEARGDAMHAVQALEGENAELRAKLAKKFPADEPPVGDQANTAPIKGDKNAEETPTINRTHFRSVDGF